MEHLRVPIVSIPDDGLRIDVEGRPEGWCPEGAQGLPLAEISLHGDLRPMESEEFLFHGRVSGAFVHACDRCLAESRIEFDAEVYWYFEHAGAKVAVEGKEVVIGSEELDDPAAYHTYSGTELDLSRPLWDEAEMALPAKFLCREECAGLCPGCGANLNESQCACETAQASEASSGFAGLKDMFPDLPQQKSEE